MLRPNNFNSKSNYRAKDAIHLACAVYAQANYLITCDDRFLKQAQRLNLQITVINPVDYVREE